MLHDGPVAVAAHDDAHLYHNSCLLFRLLCRAFGRSYAEAPDVDGKIYLENAGTLPVGSYVKVRFTRAVEYDMIGERV